MTYNWQLSDWPHFIYDLSGIEDVLFAFVERVGRVGGLLEGLPEADRDEAMIDIMVAEAIKTSEIEGEFLSRQDVMSSIRNNLGLGNALQSHDKRAQGIAELMIDVRNTFEEKLSKGKLFSWHSMVLKGSDKVKAGRWRTHKEAMQVISGPVGREKIHFEAPPSQIVPIEMFAFIKWFNDTAPGGKNEIKRAIVRSAITHLYFETIHPFEDGNGRIGRVLSEKALSQGIGRPVLLSLSKTIEANKKDYYEALKEGQRSNEITAWIAYFANRVLASQIQAEEEIDFTLRKTKFFDKFQDELNERQLKAVKRMLEEGPKGFTGGMSAKKYMAICQTSKATATRDLQDLLERGIFSATGGGRSTRYEINM
ncbi:MAG: Fic family protein [Candidatus Nitrohelix vancouverensis]|uniref:Fic family protein n=1 Tax=Candidatus Nitrohelix vancouverensis TaxID=2705534 RepID=A0A7T0C0H5_9BACT|nr:MAG: Fic family protein [Candidatus Nitrohelix vancouverensis]